MNLLKKAAEYIETKIETSKLTRVIVLAIVGFNFIGNTLLPLTLFILGESDSEFHSNQLIIIWGLLLTGTAVYYYRTLTNGQLEYFNKTVPAFLVSSYFISVVVGFFLGTLQMIFGPFIDSQPLIDLVIMEVNSWVFINSIVLIIEVIVFYWTIYVRRMNV